MNKSGRALSRRRYEQTEPSIRIAAKLARLEIIGLDHWLAIERIVDHCLECSEARRVRRFHGKPPMLRIS